MKPLRLPPARLGLADIAILCLLGGVIAVVVSFAREFEAPFSQAVRIDLSPAAAAGRLQGRGLAPRPDVSTARGARRGAGPRVERDAVHGGRLVLPHGE